MKRNLLFFLLSLSLLSKAQQWQWAKQTTSGLADGYQTSIDPNGNVFFLIRGSSLGPNSYGPYTFSAESIITKNDLSGNILWAYPLNSAPAYAISSDKYGDVYVCGKAWNGAVLHSASGTDTIYTGGGMFDAYLAKYDAYGNLLWMRSYGDSISNDCHLTLKCDPNGNCYLSGYSNYTSYNPSTHECGKFYTCKYDRNGNMLWVDSTAFENHAEPVSSDLDENGNYYVAGDYYTPVTIGSTTLSLSASWNMFIAKYDGTGLIVWVKKEGTNADGPHGIALDNKGHFYMTGVTMYPSTFGSSTILTGTGYVGMFLSKHDTSGTLLWARAEKVRSGSDVACDSNGIFVTGTFIYPVSTSPPATGTLGVGSNTVSLYSPRSQEFYVAKYDDNGNLKWTVQSIGGGGNNLGSVSNYISTDKRGTCYVTGNFQGTLQIGNNNLTSFTNGVNYDAFIVKIKDSLVPTVTGIKPMQQNTQGFSVYPNPTGGSVNVQFVASEECSSIDLYLNDVLGQRLYTKNCKGGRELSENIDVSHYPTGVYFVELVTPEKREVKKIIVE